MRMTFSLCLLAAVSVGTSAEQVTFHFERHYRQAGGAKPMVRKQTAVFQGAAADLATVVTVLKEHGRARVQADDSSVVRSTGQIDRRAIWEAIAQRCQATVTALGKGVYRIDPLPEAIPPLSHSGIMHLHAPADRQELWVWNASQALRVWSTVDWSLLAEHHASVAYLGPIAHAAGQSFSTGFDGRLCEWDLGRRCVKRTIATGRRGLRVISSVNQLCLSDDGRFAFLSHARGTMSAWQMADQRLLFEVVATRPGAGDAQIIGPDGVNANLDPSGQQVHGIDVSPDGSMLVSGGVDWAIKFWQADNGRPLAMYPATRRRLLVTRFVGHGDLLLTVDVAGVLVLWRAGGAGRDLLSRWQQPPKPVMQKHLLPKSRIAVNQARNELAAIRADGRVMRVDIKNLKTVHDSKHQLDPVQARSVALCFLPDGRLVVGADLQDRGQRLRATVLGQQGDLVQLPTSAAYRSQIRDRPADFTLSRRLRQVPEHAWQGSPEPVHLDQEF